MSEPAVQQFLRQLPPETRVLATALRDVVRGVVPDAEETVLWGGLSYHRPEIGGRVKGAICQIVVKRNEVRLDFIHGVRLPDPQRLLRGDRLAKRFVPIETTADATRPAVAALIEAAAVYNPANQPRE